MSQYANFVQALLKSSIGSSDTEIEVVPAGVGDLPPSAVPGRARLLLIDDVRRPTKFEIIEYSAVQSISGGGRRLLNVDRGVEGTASASWSAGAVTTTDLFASTLGPLHLSDAGDDKVLGFVSGGGLALRQISAEALGVISITSPILMSSSFFAPTVGPGEVSIWFDIGSDRISATFATGTVPVVTQSSASGGK